MKPAKPRIAIVEDDADQLHTIEEFLLDAGYPVWGEGSAEAFYRRFMVSPADVVILDIGLPGEDGLAVARLLRDKPQVAVIILSARDSLVDRLSGLRSGADRYLIKPVSLLELAANIDAVGKRLVQRPPEPAPGHWDLATQDWKLRSPQGRVLHLTTHEFVLLNCLIRAQGNVVSKQELITQILGPRAQNGNERLNLLVTRLRKKAGETLTDPLPLKTAHQLGYAFTAAAQISQEPMAVHGPLAYGKSRSPNEMK
jgi:DNA-binding response OmpR family regulator